MMVFLAILACSEPSENSVVEQKSADQTSPKSHSATSTEPVNMSMSGNSIFISEVMISPLKVQKYRGEWIELYNPTSKPVSLKEHSLFSNGDAGIQFGDDAVIPPNSAFLLASRKSPTGNGGLPKVDHVYKIDDIKINKTDWIELRNGEVVLDRWVIESKKVKKGYSLQRSSDGQICLPKSSYGDGDLGTPKKVNQCDS